MNKLLGISLSIIIIVLIAYGLISGNTILPIVLILLIKVILPLLPKDNSNKNDL